MATDRPDLCGIVLAAGAGRRRGTPKALVTGPGGPWLALATTLLLEGGCGRVVVVLGASAQEALTLVPVDDRVTSVQAHGWAAGMGESLRTGLGHASGVAAVVTLVDLPGTPVDIVRRVLGTDAAGDGDTRRDEVGGGTLRQAVYGGRPGHPVVIGRDHWAALRDELAGDRGARDYLVRRGVVTVECGDLHHGRDSDT